MGGHAIKPIPSNGCEWAKPILVSKQDVLTDGTAKAILVFDQTWAKTCNAGKPPNGRALSPTK